MVKAFRCEEIIINIEGEFTEREATLIKNPFYTGSVPSRKAKRKDCIEHGLIKKYNPTDESKHMIIAQCLFRVNENPKVLHADTLLDNDFELSELNIRQYYYHNVLDKLISPGRILPILSIYNFIPLTDGEIMNFPRLVKKFKCETRIVDMQDHLSNIKVSVVDNPRLSKIPDAKLIETYQARTLISEYYDKFNLDTLSPIVVCTFTNVHCPIVNIEDSLEMTNILLDNDFDIENQDSIFKLFHENEQLKNLIINADSLYYASLYKIIPMSEKLKFTMLTTK